jgi:hypothetical protein
MMNESSIRRKLDKKTNNTIRDGEGVGNARSVIKSNRVLSKAIVEAGLVGEDDHTAAEEATYDDICIICEGSSLGATCSIECYMEAVDLGFVEE